MTAGALDVRIRSGSEQVELARLTRTLNEVRLALDEIDRVYVLRGGRPKWVVSSLRDQPEFLLIRLTASATRSRCPGSALHLQSAGSAENQVDP